MNKKTVNIGEETLAYIDTGKGEPIVFIHGNMSSSVHFEPLIEKLCDKYRCVAPDLRGFGDSTYNNRFDSLDELADDVAKFMDALKIKSAFIVGWSTGGGVALKLAAEHGDKVKSLFIIEGAGHKGYPIYVKNEKYKSIVGKAYASKEEMAIDPVQVAPALTMMESHDAVSMSALWDITIYSVNKPSREDNDKWMAETLKQRNLIDIDWSLANLNMSEEWSAYRKGDGSIKKIVCPVAFTLAQNDNVVPDYMVLDNFNAFDGKAKLYTYERCGHSPMVDCLDRLAADVVEFFSTDDKK